MGRLHSLQQDFLSLRNCHSVLKAKAISSLVQWHHGCKVLLQQGHKLLIRFWDSICPTSRSPVPRLRCCLRRSQHAEPQLALNWCRSASHRASRGWASRTSSNNNSAGAGLNGVLIFLDKTSNCHIISGYMKILFVRLQRIKCNVWGHMDGKDFLQMWHCFARNMALNIRCF